MRLPDRPDLEHLRKQAKARRRERGVALASAQHELALEYGFPSWPRLVRHVRALGLEGIERQLAVADPDGLASLLASDPSAVERHVDGLVPLLYLLRRSQGTGADVRACARLLLEAGADANAFTHETEEGEWDFYAIRSAVDRDDVALVELLIEHGAERDDDAIYHACEHGSTAMLEALWKPGADAFVGHKLDFEDLRGLRLFVDRGVDVNERCCLHHAIARGRSLAIIELILNRHAQGRLQPALNSPDYPYHLMWMHFAEGSLAARLFSDYRAWRTQPPTARSPLVDSEAVVQFAEDHLARQPWFGGAAFSAADIMMMFPLNVATALNLVDAAAFPKVAAWKAKAEARPAYQRMLAKARPDGMIGSFVQNFKKRKPSRQLTHRQIEVLKLLAEGYSMKQVARVLNIAPRTVAFHKYSMMEQLEISSSAELISYAVKSGLVVN